MRLSHLPRRLARVLLPILTAACIAVAWHRRRRRRLAPSHRYVPQLDVPLWRGTDLGDTTDDAVAGAGIGGALLALAYATDETSARYWLALLARRGAPWQLQRDAWDAWQRQHRSNVTYLHTDPREDRP